MSIEPQNIYELIDKSLSELLHLKVTGRRRVEITDVIQLLVDIENVIPEFVIDGDEFVKHFSKKRR
jgi:dTDP-glucose pyrophosphorylase